MRDRNGDEKMIVRTTELKQLEDLYALPGNQLVVLYGREGSGKEQLLRLFTQNKKRFYYRARQASEQEQLHQMGREIEENYNVKLQKYAYDEYFTRVRSGDASKLVVIVDEFQYIMRKDESFLESVLKLKAKRLYPGPVMILLCSSSIVWMENDGAEKLQECAKKIDGKIKLENVTFLDVVRNFPDYTTRQCVEVYGVLGGVSSYLSRWNGKRTLKENICRNILSPTGFLFDQAQKFLATELRELALYNTILGAIASGNNKLNELFHHTGFSRAKISVYMKNLMEFEVIEKVVSFETGGWENAQKGIYRIKDNYVNFWFRFVYPHLSDLYLMNPEEFYERHIEKEIEEYLNRYFVQVCTEYLGLLNLVEKLPIQLHKMGTWIGKQGTIDIVAQNSIRENIVGLCNWSKPQLTWQDYEELEETMKRAKIKAKYYYFFSAEGFEASLQELAGKDERYVLIDMKEL